MNGSGQAVLAMLFSISLVISVFLSPILGRLALRTMQFVQWPKSASIETHRQPMPVLGGLAIFLGTLGAFFMVAPWSDLEKRFLLASGVIVFLGLIDDNKPLAIPAKLAGQLLAVGILLLHSPAGDSLIPQLFGPRVLNQVIAILWLVRMINAVNFLDVMDGLAAGTSAIALAGMFLLTIFVPGDQPVARLSVAVAGGVLAFLIYNFFPARIFMGNSGSQFLGLILGSLALRIASRSTPYIAALAPILLLGIPLFEISFTSVMRILTGKLPWKGSKDHYALRLFKAGFSVRQIVLITYLVGLLLIPCAISVAKADTTREVLVILVLILLIGLGIGVWLSRIADPQAEKFKSSVSGTLEKL